MSGRRVVEIDISLTKMILVVAVLFTIGAIVGVAIGFRVAQMRLCPPVPDCLSTIARIGGILWNGTM